MIRHVCCTVCGEEESVKFAERAGYDIDDNKFRFLCTYCNQTMRNAFPQLTDEHGFILPAANRVALYCALHDLVDVAIRATEEVG